MYLCDLEAWQQCYGREQQLPGVNLTPEQMFWVSAGIMQCGKYKDKALAQFVRVDTHTPNDFRLKVSKYCKYNSFYTQRPRLESYILAGISFKPRGFCKRLWMQTREPNESKKQV